ncbi:MAG: hypothetical protein WA982_02325 [Rubrobacteraceae bacterium]
MNRENKPSKVVEWILVGLMGICSLLIVAAIVVFDLAGNSFFISIIWLLLGASVSIGLQILAHRIAGNSRSYWKFIFLIYVVVLLGGLALLAFFPEWFLGTSVDRPSSVIPSLSSPVSFYLGLIAGIGGAKTFLPKNSGRVL